MKIIVFVALSLLAAGAQAAGNYATQGTTGNYATAPPKQPVEIVPRPPRPVYPNYPVYPGYGGYGYGYPNEPQQYESPSTIHPALTNGNAQLEILQSMIDRCVSTFRQERKTNVFQNTKSCVIRASGQLNSVGSAIDRSVSLGGQPGYVEFRASADSVVDSFRQMRLEMEAIVGRHEFQEWYNQAPK